MGYVIVFLGAGISGALRHGVNILVTWLVGINFPFHSLLINVSGSFLMGIITEYFALRGTASEQLRLFLTTGILGGFTTFSAFSLDAFLLYERSQLGLAALYVMGSVAIAILGLFLGLGIVRHLM